jgi:hypothetical protein
MAQQPTPDPKQVYRQYVNRTLGAEFDRSYPGAFAATDIHAVIELPGNQVSTLGQMAALSISTHRDTFPVTSMGTVAARGFTQGHRTVAGTLIFHTIDQAAFSYSGNAWRQRYGADGDPQKVFGPPAADELPLFDIHLSYVNEVGMVSYESLYGVRVLDFGKTISLENLHPIESYSYMALDYVPLRPVISGAQVRNMGLQRLKDKKPFQWAGDGPVDPFPSPLA